MRRYCSLTVKGFLTALSAIVALAAVWTAGHYLKRIIFDSDDDLWDCVRAAVTPAIVAFFRGELWENLVQNFKLQIFLCSSAATGGLIYLALAELFGLPI